MLLSTISTALAISMIVVVDVIAHSAVDVARFYPGSAFPANIKQAIYYKWFSIHFLRPAYEASFVEIHVSWGRYSKFKIAFGNLKIELGHS